MQLYAFTYTITTYGSQAYTTAKAVYATHASYKIHTQATKYTRKLQKLDV